MKDEAGLDISEVVKREQLRLLNFIRRRVPDPRDAEDILQDVKEGLHSARCYS